MSSTHAPIEDYALIGDCHSAALVCRNGSIDWLCWPRFDSDACFAALLGTPENGRWLLAPVEPAKVSRRYRPDTLILETRFETQSGSVLVIDFMPLRGEAPDLIRIVVGERGEVRMHTELVLRFGFGANVPWVTRIAPNTWQAIAGPDRITLVTGAPMHGEDERSVADFVVRAGERETFVMAYSQSHLPLPHPLDVDEALRHTEEFWRDWVGQCTAFGRWSASIRRSLITLRALVYEPTGGIVAAPTTSLPELIGGSRNWDYRYCWLRDATLTLLAFMDAGFLAEAGAWRDWLLRAVAGSPRQMQIMYGLAGERRLTEWEVPWLQGYEQSRPVRVGNAAHSQPQLDVYGELMDAMHQVRAAGIETLGRGWAIQYELLEWLVDHWRDPDCGIWEIRGPLRQFTHSKVMCWVAFDRAIRDAERFGFECPLDRWRKVRAEIHEEVCTHGYDAARNCFVQSYGSKYLDASLLQLPVLGFLPPDDPRILGTIAAIERELRRDIFVRRYDTASSVDGLPGSEGSFLACSFWLVDAYALCGRRREAEALFDGLVALGNDLGLFSEEYDSTHRRMLGNFPQAFTHLALVASAFNLSHDRQPAEQRSRDDGAGAAKPQA